MSKQIKRKITVNPTTLSAENKRPSVFERLGTKAAPTGGKDHCRHWAQGGSCPYGKGCKYSATHTLVSPSKQRAAKQQQQQQSQQIAVAAAATKRRHAVGEPPDRRLRPGEHDEWEQWDPDELEDADPDDLEKRRQELQRELELQMKMETKAKKKERKVSKKESSPSSESSSSSTDSSYSSEDSSSSSSSSGDVRRKKVKKVKAKRSSSTSSDDRSRGKHKSKTKRTSKSATISTDKPKKPPKTPKPLTKSPSPPKVQKKSETPPVKTKQQQQQQPLLPKKVISENSPRPQSRSGNNQKHRTPSPKASKDRDREKEKEREKERDREREKEKEREREKERDRARDRAKERDKERDHKRKESNRSPKRDNTNRDGRSGNKRRDSPDSGPSRDRKSTPVKNKSSISNSGRRDHKSPQRDDRRSDKRDDRGRSRGKDNSRSTVDKGRSKDRRDSRDRERDRDRERRLAREEREAAREKEREEALARCQERQRERERLKELAKKEEERRGRDRSRREDRGLDKPTGDRVERLLPLPEDRVPPSRKAHSLERDNRGGGGGGGDRRDRDRRGDRTPPDSRTASRKSHDRLDRVYDRNFDRDRDRDYGSRSRDGGDRRLDDKDYNSPYDRSRHDDRRYLDMDEHYNESGRDDRIGLERGGYCDERRGRGRDLWEMRDDRDADRDQLDHRGRYQRDGDLKSREWDPEYGEHGEWDRTARRPPPPLEWENRDNWDSGMDHKQMEEEWRHYSRSMEGWSNEERRRWNNDWRERSRPRSNTSHHVDVNEDSNAESRKKESVQPPPKVEGGEPMAVLSEETSRDCSAQKRPADDQQDASVDIKKLKTEIPAPVPVLEDDLSEISDDIDEILNRDEEILCPAPDEPQPETTTTTTEDASLKDHNTSTASQSPSRSPNKSILVKDGSIDEENMELDFEEISEDELEEESRAKGIGDALGVDWASLVAESKPRIKPISSAKLRWESHHVLVNMGVSVRLAGEQLVKSIYSQHAEAQRKELPEENKSPPHIKLEPGDPNLNGIKQEIEDLPELEQKFEPEEISHPIAAIQAANKEKQSIRKTLFSNVGPFRRALCARRDLIIRRHLCNLPPNDAYVEAPKRHDPDLLKVATQLFERCI